MPYSVWPSASTRATPGQTSIVVLPGAGALALAGGSVTVAANGLPFSTTFPATENPISQGGIWVNGRDTGIDWKNLKTNGSGVFAESLTGQTAGVYDDGIAHLSTGYHSFAANQYVQATVYRAASYTAGHEIELLLRFQITAHNARGYEVYWSTNDGLALVRWEGAVNSFTPLVNTSLVANDGDVLRFEASGSTLTVKVNGVQKLQTTDSTWTTGQPGIGNNPYDAAGTPTSFGWKNYTAGEL
ncbi:MAG: hypothetical protein JSS57_00505 [Proteobacteria bacterium]|nr:hypothetical protein [Pseudomonadota bacterium]